MATALVSEFGADLAQTCFMNASSDLPSTSVNRCQVPSMFMFALIMSLGSIKC